MHFKIGLQIGNYTFHYECNTVEVAMDVLNDIFFLKPWAKKLDNKGYRQILDDMVAGKRTGYNCQPISISYITGDAY